MVKNSYHVVFGPSGGWDIMTRGAESALSHFDHKDEAIRYARDLSRGEHTDLYIHRKDGTVQQKDSYSKDPHTSRNSHHKKLA